MCAAVWLGWSSGCALYVFRFELYARATRRSRTLICRNLFVNHLPSLGHAMDGRADEETRAPLLDSQPTSAQNDSEECLWNRLVWKNGFFLASLSAFTFSALLVSVKETEELVPELQIIWARGLVVSVGVPIAARVFTPGVSIIGKRENLFLLLMVGLVGFAQNVTGWGALEYIQICEYVALYLSNSILTASLAAIMGLDRWSRITPIAVALSVVGVLLITRPPMIFSAYGLVWDANRIMGLSLGVFCSTGVSAVILLARKLKNREGSITLIFWQGLVLFIGLSICLTVGYPSKPVFRLSYYEYLFMMIPALLSNLAWFLVYRSVQLTSATVGSVMGSTELLWSFLFDLLIFKEPFSMLAVVGCFCVVGSSVIVGHAVVCKEQPKIQGDPVAQHSVGSRGSMQG